MADEQKPTPDESATPATGETTTSQPKQKVDTGDADHMHVKVYAPFKVYFDGIATSISAVNETGPFDILPKHHNFMTLINQGEVIVRTDQSEEKFKIMRGIMHVKADDVVVFLDV